MNNHQNGKYDIQHILPVVNNDASLSQTVSSMDTHFGLGYWCAFAAWTGVLLCMVCCGEVLIGMGIAALCFGLGVIADASQHEEDFNLYYSLGPVESECIAVGLLWLAVGGCKKCCHGCQTTAISSKWSIYIGVLHLLMALVAIDYLVLEDALPWVLASVGLAWIGGGIGSQLWEETTKDAATTVARYNKLEPNSNAEKVDSTETSEAEEWEPGQEINDFA